MYFDSDTKLVIFGAVILLLAGIIVGRRRGLMAGLFFSVSFCIIFLVLLAVGLLLCLGRPPVIFYYVFLVFVISIAGSLPAEIKFKNTSNEFKCLLCKNFVNYKNDKCPNCGADMTSEKIWKKKTK